MYAGIVLGIGALAGQQGSPVLTIAAAVAVALLFQPVRQRARRVANRLVYGERATPYQVLSDFADHMAGQLDYDKAVDRMVAVLAGATGAIRAEAWILVGAQLRPVTIWPEGSPRPGALGVADDADLPAFGTGTRAVAVRHGNELLGALTLEKPRSEPLTAAEDKLLHDLAAQAGLVFRNRRLTAELRASIEELRASRRRLVEAQDAERRKIERNLHDGAQQQLVALSIQLGLLEESAGDAGYVRELAPQLKSAVRAALDDLRDLARGIYPPLLAEQGLAAALAGQVRKAPLPVCVEADGVGRYPQDTESTVYFCALEALQNVAKYAGAAQATVGLSCARRRPGVHRDRRRRRVRPGRDPAGAAACRAWPTGWPRSAAPWTSARGPGTAPRCGAGCPCPAGAADRYAAADQLTTMASDDKPPATY